MPEIKVTTSVDLRGFRELDAEITRMMEKSKQLSDNFKSIGNFTASSPSGVINRNPSGNIQPVSAPDAGGIVHQPSSMSQQHRQSFGQGQQYNLNTPNGYIRYMEDVVGPASDMLGNLRSGKVSSQFGVKYQGYSTVTNKYKPSTTDFQNWFIKQGNLINQMDSEMLKDYMNASSNFNANSSSLHPEVKRFIANYGSQLGAPQASTTMGVIPQTRSSRFGQHFVNNLKGGSFSGALGAGLKGAIGGSLIDMAAGGGEAGAVAGGLGAGAIGMADGPLGAIAAIGIEKLISAATNTIGQGIKSFQDTIPAFSQLSHALDNAKNSAEGFRYATQMAGAQVGMNAQQSTQAAMTLTQAYGNSTGGTKGITGLVSQAGRFGLLNGIDPNTMASMMSMAGTLGISNGVGSPMTSQQFNEMLLNMTQLSGMQGRQQSLYGGLLSVYSGLGSMNPIVTSANSTAAIYTAMNKTGIQGLQGQNGANILNQMNSTLGSGQGLAGIMGMAAINQASGGKITNPWQMKSIEEQGLGAHIGNTTYGAQLQQMVKQMAPGDIYTQAGILSSITGISVNQAMNMLQSGAMGAQSISTKSNQSSRMTKIDQTNSASARINVAASGVGYAKNLLNALGAQATGTATTVGVNGTTGSYTGTTLAGGNGKALSPSQSRFPAYQSGGSGINQWSSQIQSASKITGVPISVIEAIMNNEDASGNPSAGSLGGAYGLMQLEPGTAGATNADRQNPSKNILYGAKYLASLSKMFNGNWALAAAAYYAGPGAVQSHVSKSQYGDSLSQLSGDLSFVPDPSANKLTAAQYAAKFEAGATGMNASLTPNPETERFGPVGTATNVVSLSASTIQQLTISFASELQKQGMLSGGKIPSR